MSAGFSAQSAATISVCLVAASVVAWSVLEGSDVPTALMAETR